MPEDTKSFLAEKVFNESKNISFLIKFLLFNLNNNFDISETEYYVGIPVLEQLG